MSKRATSLLLLISLSLGLGTAPDAASAQSGRQGKQPLKGHVTESASKYPFIDGVKETVPKGTKIDLTFSCNLNSEIDQKGGEVMARISLDLKDGRKVVLPSGWYMHGNIIESHGQRRLGRDGYSVVEFDKIVSPDGQWDLPFHAQFSTADNQLKAVAKVVGKDTLMVTKGAIVGSIFSVQATGLSTAISTYGISVGAGAACGATLGLIGALKRKGKISSIHPGDETHLTLAAPIELPGFNPDLIPSAAPRKKIDNLDMTVLRHHFGKDPFGDESARLLTVDLKVDNRTDREYSFFDLAVVSDHDKRYYPFMMGGKDAAWKKKVPAKTEQEGTMTFSVDSPKHKYWLLLLDKANREEISRAPVN